MATQLDSLQISQLKSLALGLHHEPRNFDVSRIATAPKSPPATDSVSTSNRSHELNTKTPKARHVSSPITNHKPPSSARSIPPRSSSHSPRHPPCAIDAELPSTIPDSARLRMTTSSSQAEGDTQEISQQAVDEFIRQSKLENEAKRGVAACDGTCNTYESSLCSFHQGQTGYVDLIGGLEQPLKVSPDEPYNYGNESDPLSPVVDVRAELYPESKRFQQPKTPATNGKKRNHAGEFISQGDSSSKRPINPFAGNMIGLDAMMNPSQAFKATQAATSPLTQVTPSDTLSERPSPDMCSIHRPASTRVVSSPPQITGSRMVRAVTEPQTTYISMQESQAKRDQLARQSAMELGRSGAVSSDEDFESDDSQPRRRRNRRKIDLRARGHLIGVKEPLRPVSSGRGRWGGEKQLQRSEYKCRSGRGASEALVISDDLPAEGNVTEAETEHEEDRGDSLAEEIDELADDNKENIEVPMTISRPNQRRSPRVELEATPSRPCNAITLDSSTDKSTPRVRNHGSADSSNLQQNFNLPEGTQTSAVADSQPAPYIERVPQRSEIMSDQSLPSSPSEVRVPKGWHVSMLATSRPEILSRGDQVVGNLGNSAVGFQKSANLLHTDSLAKSNQIRPLPISKQSNRSAIAQTIPRARVFSVDSTPPRLTGDDRSETSHQDQRALENQHKSKRPYADAEMETKDLRSESVTNTTENQANIEFQKDIVNSSLRGIPSTLPNTIPETNSAEKHLGDHTEPARSSAAFESSHSNTKSPKILLETLQPHAASGSTPFETAQTTVLNSPSKLPHVNLQHQPSHHLPSSRAKSIPAKSLAQIAADPSPLDVIGEVDMDIDLITSEDIEFQTVIAGSSPTRHVKKRRRGNKGHVLQVTQPKVDVLPVDTNQQAVNEPINPENCTTDELAVNHSTLGEKNNEDEPTATTSTKVGEASSISPPPELTPSSQGRPEKVRTLTSNNLGHEAEGKKNKKVPSLTGSVLPVPLHEKAITPWNSINNGISDRPIVASDRVFAHFNGKPSAYFPATCIEVEPGDKPRYKVCFDDYQIDKVGGFNVRRLELRIGDTIKVLNSRKETFVVQGFADRYQPPAQPNPEHPSKRKPIVFCDIFGYQTVIVSVKQPKALNRNPAEQRSVPLKDVYLTQTMWGKYKDRPFVPVVPDSSFELQTQSDQPSTPSTPTSQNRRTKISFLASPHSTTSVASTGSGLFANNIFAVTFASDSTIAEETRENITNQILSNGGRIVDGFEELFDIPPLKLTSSFKQSPKNPTKSGFCLTQAARAIGFACVISDKHCRKAKYIQALALGIPCLATRWVDDCISKQRILPCEPYLLAAGESEYLRGAIRSRVLQPYDPNTTSLSQIVANGPRFLSGKSILLIMSKAEEETMRFYPLFTHALGARRISRALSLEAAAKAIAKAQADGELWDFIYSHDHDKKYRGEENRRRVERYLLGASSTGQNRKRGRSEDGTTRVVGNEFLIQSLILGRLTD